MNDQEKFELFYKVNFPTLDVLTPKLVYGKFLYSSETINERFLLKILTSLGWTMGLIDKPRNYHNENVSRKSKLWYSYEKNILRGKKYYI